MNDSYFIDEDSVLTLPVNGILSNDSDVDGDPLTAHSLSGPSNGIVNLNPDGSLTYTPNANFNGVDSFTYRASDGLTYSGAATVSITVNPVNDDPVAQNYSNIMFFNQTLTANLQSSVSDVDMDAFTLALVSGPAHGSIVLQRNGSFVYTPQNDFQGTDTFYFVASDGVVSGNIGTATITVIRQIVNPSNGSSGSGGFSVSASTGTTGTSSSSSIGTAPSATATGSSAASATSSAIASGGSSNSGGKSVIPFEATNPMVGTQGTLTNNAEEDQNKLIGILPKLKVAEADRINLKAVDASANESGRSLANEFSRRTFKSSERYDFDSVFDQHASNREMSQLNAQRTMVYQEISALAKTQSESAAEQLKNNTHIKDSVVGSVGVVTTGFSVGYLFWVIRGGMLVSGLIAQVPAWSMLDPLLVVDGDQKDDDKESLQHIMDRQQAKLKSTQETTDSIQENTSASESN